jgi:hypothetical protein
MQACGPMNNALFPCSNSIPDNLPTFIASSFAFKIPNSKRRNLNCYKSQSLKDRIQEYLSRFRNKKRKDPADPMTFQYPLTLDTIHLRNCVVLKDRYEILGLMPKNARVAEVGVLGGDFSEHILKQTNPEQLFLIDTFCSDDWASNEPRRFLKEDHFDFIKKKFQPEIEKKQVSLIKGISWKCLAEIEDNFFDWIYLDADHRYQGVKKDLAQALRVVKPDGYIVMNDYIFYSHSEHSAYGVIHAVNEVCIQEGFELIYLALHPQMYCDVVMRRIKL